MPPYFVSSALWTCWWALPRSDFALETNDANASEPQTHSNANAAWDPRRMFFMASAQGNRRVRLTG